MTTAAYLADLAYEDAEWTCMTAPNPWPATDCPTCNGTGLMMTGDYDDTTGTYDTDEVPCPCLPGEPNVPTIFGVPYWPA